MRPCVLLCLAAIVGCAGPRVSPTDQALIERADRLHEVLAPAVVESRSARLDRYFTQLAERITAAAKELDQQGLIRPAGDDGGAGGAWVFGKDIEFHLVDSELPNAFTSGGKHVYVYTGLLQACQSEDELASLLCHEYAHLYARHVLQDLRQEEPTSGGAEAALIYPYATLRITPAQGKQAEAIALMVYTKGGWDPARYASLYERLGSKTGGGNIDSSLMRERVADAERRMRELPSAANDWIRPPIADDARFAQMLEEARGLAGATSPPQRTGLLLATFPSCLAGGETAGQVAARERLFPPTPTQTGNQWGKGVAGRGG